MRVVNTWIVGIISAVIYLVARPPLYERDGYMYHLLGRDFLSGTNPHHLLWNGVQYLLNGFDAFAGIHSVITFQLFGMACGVASAILLADVLFRLSGNRWFSILAALFVAFAPWTWFMAFQNQPYALQFLLLVLFLRCFVTDDGSLPRGRAFAIAASCAVGMVMLQEAAVLVVVAAGVCFLVLGGWHRLASWAAATALPTAALYLGMAAMRGVRTPTAFWLWLTGYLRSQHSLQVEFPELLPRSVMGIVSTFVNQDALKDAVADQWSAAAILWFYAALGIAFAAALAWVFARRRRAAPADEARHRAMVWVSVATMLSWGFFCMLWEPTNYYWFILLAPFFVYVVATFRPGARALRVAGVALAIAMVWNLHADHDADAQGARRAPEPQMRVIDAHMRAGDLLWVVDLGWTDDVDYDLLSAISGFEHGPTIRALSDVVGRSPNESAWQRAILDSSATVLAHGGRVFLSGQTFDTSIYEQRWDETPFADYTVERPFRVDWTTLGRDLPAFLHRTYQMAPAGFAIGPDTILRLAPTP